MLFSINLDFDFTFPFVLMEVMFTISIMRFGETLLRALYDCFSQRLSKTVRVAEELDEQFMDFCLQITDDGANAQTFCDPLKTAANAYFVHYLASYSKEETEASKVFVVLECKKRFSKREIEDFLKSKCKLDAMFAFVEKPDPTFKHVTVHLEKQEFKPFCWHFPAKKLFARGDMSKYLRKPKKALASIKTTEIKELNGLGEVGNFEAIKELE
eukprot:Stramenopile-MAST_4_protein_5404